MTLRCELNINGGSRRVLIMAGEEETLEHVALRLTAACLFFDGEPVEPGPADHALADIGFVPDLMVRNEAGGVGVWVECGNVAMNKLTKVNRRVQGRLVVLKEDEPAGRRLREVVTAELNKSEKIEILAWDRKDFAAWKAALKESNYVYGEASGHSLNLVLNDAAFSVQLIAC
jgi:uncharacterized protein YaeQ